MENPPSSPRPCPFIGRRGAFRPRAAWWGLQSSYRRICMFTPASRFNRAPHTGRRMSPAGPCMTQNGLAGRFPLVGRTGQGPDGWCGVVMPIGADRAPRAGPACPSSGAAEAEARLSLRALGFPKRACRCCATRPCCPRLPRRTGKVESYGRSGPGDRAQLSTPSPLRTVAGPASPDPSHA